MESTMEVRENVPEHLNDVKVLKHFDRLKKTLAGDTQGPVSVEVHPTNLCNLDCPFCGYKQLEDFYYKNPSKGKLSEKELLDLADLFAKMGVKAVTISGGGEPSLHKSFVPFIQRINHHNIKFGITTNGVLITDPLDNDVLKAEYVRFSLYTTETKLQLETALKNLKRLLQKRDSINQNCKIGVGILVSPTNYLENEEIVKKVNELKVDYIAFRPEVIFDQPKRDWSKAIEFYENKSSIDNTNLGQLKRRILEIDYRRDYKRCMSINLTSHIDADGNVYPCCEQTGNKAYLMGNIREQSFEDIWYSEKYKKLRETLNAQACPFCRYNYKNVVMNKALAGEISPEQFPQEIENSHADFL